jgi:hypothetical protein
VEPFAAAHEREVSPHPDGEAEPRPPRAWISCERCSLRIEADIDDATPSGVVEE